MKNLEISLRIAAYDNCKLLEMDKEEIEKLVISIVASQLNKLGLLLPVQ
jgi:hypothetical protein